MSIWINVQTLEGHNLRAAGFEGESLLEALKRSRVAINSSCDGGEEGYNLIERPIEPQAAYPQCRECHVVGLPHAAARRRLGR